MGIFDGIPSILTDWLIGSWFYVYGLKMSYVYAWKDGLEHPNPTFPSIFTVYANRSTGSLQDNQGHFNLRGWKPNDRRKACFPANNGTFREAWSNHPARSQRGQPTHKDQYDVQYFWEAEGQRLFHYTTIQSILFQSVHHTYRESFSSSSIVSISCGFAPIICPDSKSLFNIMFFYPQKQGIFSTIWLPLITRVDHSSSRSTAGVTPVPHPEKPAQLWCKQTGKRPEVLWRTD